MGVFGKIMDSLRLSDNEDDDYFLDDDYEDEKPEKKSFFGKKDKELDDDYGYDEPDEPVSKPCLLYTSAGTSQDRSGIFSDPDPVRSQ